MGVSEVNRERMKTKVVLAYFTGDVGIEAGKDDGAVFEMFGLALVYDRISHYGRYRGGLFPDCGF